jgi:hypothetical protein
MFFHFPFPGLRMLFALPWGGATALAGDRRVRPACSRLSVKSAPGRPPVADTEDVVRGVEPEWEGQWKTLRHL